MHAALDLSGTDETKLKAIEAKINSVVAQKVALEQKVARLEQQHAGGWDGGVGWGGESCTCAHLPIMRLTHPAPPPPPPPHTHTVACSRD